MHQSAARLALFFVALCIPGAGLALESGDQFKQWAAQCEIGSNGEENCHIFQNLVLAENADQKQVLRMSLGYPSGSGQPVAQFLMPLGIWLPRGMTLAVDDGEPQNFPILVCGSNGCQTTLRVQPDLIEALNQGKQLTVTLFNANQQPVRIPIDLSGITAGLAALQ